MTVIDRRTFLKGAAAAGGAAALSAGPFAGFVARVAAGSDVDLGPLGPVPDQRDGKVRLWLPEGLQYRSFHDTDGPPIFLDDGSQLQGRHDGMGAFVGSRGDTVLIRNHEINNPGPAFGDPATAYDTMARGGCTTTVVSDAGEVREAWTSLNGTMMNCAGGQMPWGAWVTCEETVNGPDVGPDFTGVSNIPLTRPHGYIFEVPVEGNSGGEPITAAGRFPHEAVSFDPDEGILYLTEDNFAFPSGFYRYIPPSNPMETGFLADGGRLQMLKVVDVDNAHLEAHQSAGTSYPVEWVDIADPNPQFPFTPGTTAPTTNDEALTYVGNQGRAQGAAGFSRLEGQVFDRGVAYFVSTQGGGAAETGPELTAGYGNGTGQVWAYRPADMTLTCVFQSPSNSVLDFPDNVTTSPRGTVILCEDSAGDNFIRGLSRKGQLYDIALNRLTNNTTGAPRFGEEFAGSTFNRNGKTLYVNIQASLGVSFAIWGNWQKLGV
ncbi:MAG TPA: alkaline phosphatase PhoX [Candidatus Limnocylindrales bacterium]|nr:alkaline phosphatase PhoX [Candidatus Limnocylindrales bacterium]